MNIYSRIFWSPCDAPGRLAILSRPTAERLTAEIAAWREAGVSIVVSLLEPGEQVELGLLREAELCAQAGIEFVSLPIADGGVPASRRDAGALVRRLAKAIAVSSLVGIHCRAGIGRSAIGRYPILRYLALRLLEGSPVQPVQLAADPASPRASTQVDSVDRPTTAVETRPAAEVALKRSGRRG